MNGRLATLQDATRAIYMLLRIAILKESGTHLNERHSEVFQTITLAPV